MISPPFEWQAKVNESGMVLPDRIDEPVNAQFLAELERMPDYVRALDPEGMAPEEFDTYGATVRTLRQFLAADEELDQIVRDVILPAP